MSTSSLFSSSQSSSPVGSPMKEIEIESRPCRGSGPSIAPDLGKDPDKLAIWKSQVLIPSEDFFYLGPYNTPTLVNSFKHLFPSRPNEPLLASLPTINAHFMNNTHETFRTAFPLKKGKYQIWFDKMIKEKGKDWEEMGILPLTKLSTEPIQYNCALLCAALHFWHPSTSSFHVRLGMISPTLMDLAAITGLRPDGDFPYFEVVDKKNPSDLVPDLEVMTYKAFLERNMGLEGSPVSNKEHVAFLLFWFSKYVFCRKGLQVPNMYIPVAIALHKKQKFALGPCILAALYEGLDEAYWKLKNGEALKNFSRPL